MLKKKSKTTRELVLRVISSRRNFYGVFMTLRIMRINDATSRFSFIVSKKVAARATDRNKIKRRGYSIIEGIYTGVEPHMAALFFVKKEACKASFADLRKESIELLRKGGILKR